MIKFISGALNPDQPWVQKQPENASKRRIKCIQFAKQEEPTEIFPARSKQLRLDARASKAWGLAGVRRGSAAGPRRDEGEGVEPRSLPCSPSRVYPGRRMRIGRPSTAQGWCGLDRTPQVVTSGDKATRRRGQEGHCSGVNAKSDGVRPAVSCIGSKQGISLPHCAPAGGRWQPGRHGVLSQGARARSAALCRACSECSAMAVGKHGHMPERSDVHARRGAAAVGEIGCAVMFDWRRAAGRPWTVAACWCQVVWQEGRRRPRPLPAVSAM